MVEREARDQLAEQLRHLVAGQITNDEFEDRLTPASSDDPATEEIFDAAWSLYSDQKEYRLVGKDRIPSEGRREIARWILFLKGDLEYEWPCLGCLGHIGFTLVYLATLGLAGALSRRWMERRGDLSLWPFIRRADYEAALRNPPYLAGAG